MYKWHLRNPCTVKDLMEKMFEWHKVGYIDPAVWEQLIRHKVNPALMPSPAALQSLPLPLPGADRRHTSTAEEFHPFVS